MVAPAPSRHPARNVPNRKSGNRPVSPLRSEQARFYNAPHKVRAL